MTVNTPRHIQLLHPDSTDPFQSVNLRAEEGAPVAWSIQSYTLHGGLSEGVHVVEVNNGKLSFFLLPTRGMNIWKAQCGDVRLGWDSPVKSPVHPAFVNQEERGGLGWLRGFNEWFVRCGLNSMGPPGVDSWEDENGNASQYPLTLHGKIANLPARAVSVEVTDTAIIVKGEVDETMFLGPTLRLNTEIRSEFGSYALTVTDTVTNLGDSPQQHQMLYHINYGESLLEDGAKVVAPFKEMSPRDPRSAEGIEHFDQYDAPRAGFVEQAYFFKLLGTASSGQTVVMLHNADASQASLLRYSLNDFPCFTVWKNTAGKADGYVTGLEPGTSFPNARQFEREQGRVVKLAGGESRTTTLTIEALDTPEAVAQALSEIQHLQQPTTPTIHPHPFPGTSC